MKNIQPKWVILVVVVLLIGKLFVPDFWPKAPSGLNASGFRWDRERQWAALEQRFAAAKQGNCADIGPRADGEMMAFMELASRADLTTLDASMPKFFEISADIAACPASLPRLLEVAAGLRDRAKMLTQSNEFDRDALYRVMYGSRIAVEEALLQNPAAQVSDRVMGAASDNAEPSAEVQGVRLQSGDILVSRGGAPTSALIARGNDYPGNFSHVALVHIDESSHVVSIVESHIERGVVVSSVDQYLGDKKLRILALRPRERWVAQRAHAAATNAIARARDHHTPYDFEMNYNDDEKQFCSEVIYDAYRSQQISLWRNLSTMSSQGVVSWLAAFGVTHFQTLAPADLEYDPQLDVVVEWRNMDALWDDHLDNAVIDAMLERAERGEELSYAYYKLPLARLAKYYSQLLNLFGGVGPVPEGMAAVTALRAQHLADMHVERKTQLAERARAFEQRHHMRPPYWKLVEMVYATSPN